jgi:hypothetical protein
MRHRHQPQALCKSRINREAFDCAQEKIFPKNVAAQNRALSQRFIRF